MSIVNRNIARGRIQLQVQMRNFSESNLLIRLHFHRGGGGKHNPALHCSLAKWLPATRSRSLVSVPPANQTQKPHRPGKINTHPTSTMQSERQSAAHKQNRRVIIIITIPPCNFFDIVVSSLTRFPVAVVTIWFLPVAGGLILCAAEREQPGQGALIASQCNIAA